MRPASKRVAGLLFLLGLSGCETSSASSVASLSYKFGNEALHPRVEEEGYYFQMALEISGYQGQRLQVAIFTDEGNYLGSESVVSPYYSKKFRVFVPQINLRNISEDMGFSVYILSPNDTDTFIEKTHYPRSNIPTPPLAWEWLRYDVEAPMDGGGTGIRLTLNLHTRGHKGQRMRTVTLVRDQGMQDFPASKGGPYRIEGPGLNFDRDSGVFKNLEFTVRYDDLKRLDPAQEIVLTPAVRMGERIITGNVHIHVWAGGSLERVERKIEQRIEKYDTAIADLRRRLQVLQRE